jgi:hypothetical protein
MKKRFLGITLVISQSLIGQIVYVDNFDGVYPATQGLVTYNLDLNIDGQVDVKLYFGSWNNSCFNGSTSGPAVRFISNTNTFGQNLVNGNGNGVMGIDCTNDTLNMYDSWSATSMIYAGNMPWNGYCFNMGVGNHKQGVRLILTNPANGALGYKYGYIDYSLSSIGDVIIHGWYYENTFNVPIVANTLLDYPYDGNCIHYDTVTVNDTVTTTIYDTITTTIYDTVTTTIYTTVTDTLIINAALGLPSPNNLNTLKVFPNPANDHITIDNGDYLNMLGYSIKIENSAGQQVFQSQINQPQFYIDLGSWTGYGLYYIHLIDPNNNTVTIRKLVLQ